MSPAPDCPFRRAARAGLLAAATALVLGGCTQTRSSLGLDQQAPDEFMVVSRAPLAMPPSLDVLPEPQPGVNRPQELQPAEQAQFVLFGGQAPGDGQPSKIETALLDSTGALFVDPSIRQAVDEEDTSLASDETWLESLQFWRERVDPTAVLIDPAKEQARLQSNAALSLPANNGDFEGVIIVPKEKGLLEGIF